MPLPLAVLLLPALYWDRPPDTAPVLRKAGIERIYAPPGQVEVWRKAGFRADPFDRDHAAPATAPKVEYHMDVASATRVPWVDANGWRFERDPTSRYFYDTPAGAAALAAAEAFAYGVDAAIRIDPRDLETFAHMQRFLSEIGGPQLPVRANIAVVDDHSETMGEILNLMARHNLLFEVVSAPDAKHDVSIQLGTAEYSADEAADPYSFAMKVRRRLTDEKRLVRIYGSNVVLIRLTGDASRARLHLLNYGEAAVRGLRVRVLGSYPTGKLAAFGQPGAKLDDYSVQDGATEFSISELGIYGVIDLSTPPHRN